MDYIIIGLLVAVVVILLFKPTKKDDTGITREEVESIIAKENAKTLDFMHKQIEQQTLTQRSLQEQLANVETQRFNEFSQSTQTSIGTLRKTVAEMTTSLDNRFENFQNNFENRVTAMQVSNEKKLDEMRNTVDEKLQKTLEDKLGQSFKLVSERLEQVYKSLGEMQKLSGGVDELKKVLSNVKTRGVLGEVQLGAILEQILSPEQYDSNVATKKGSQERVEFAVKLPGDGSDTIYLPIDAKFPMDAYQNLLDAYDSADAKAVDEAAKVLTNRIKSFAKDISTKYINVPNTTEFAIMFLPVEGLYAEVVRRGMIEELQKMKINLAGPTTMAALLNSLQMGFRTLAIQKHSGEVWKILEGVKSEFATFGKVLEKTQERMVQASEELDKLVGVRTRAINRKLKTVALDEVQEVKLLDE